MAKNRPGNRARQKGAAAGRSAATKFESEPVLGESLDVVLLDAGGGRKLERFGDVLLSRPSSQALWNTSLPKQHWTAAAAKFQRESSGEGYWTDRADVVIPESWLVEAEGLRFVLKRTGFGHLGIFPEQRDQWAWIQERCRGVDSEAFSVLNLFAYTGGSSLAAAKAGAAVCHVDGARGIVDWARENARRSELGEHPIRWIVDDVLGFVKRELRRERRYQGIVLDPPSYGRGPKGQTWKLEEDLPSLLADCRRLLADDARFMLLSCHSQGVTPLGLANLLRDVVPKGGSIESGEMCLKDEGGRPLPCGGFARWSAEEG